MTSEEMLVEIRKTHPNSFLVTYDELPKPTKANYKKTNNSFLIICKKNTRAVIELDIEDPVQCNEMVKLCKDL